MCALYFLSFSSVSSFVTVEIAHFSGVLSYLNKLRNVRTPSMAPQLELVLKDLYYC